MSSQAFLTGDRSAVVGQRLVEGVEGACEQFAVVAAGAGEERRDAAGLVGLVVDVVAGLQSAVGPPGASEPSKAQDAVGQEPSAAGCRGRPPHSVVPVPDAQVEMVVGLQQEPRDLGVVAETRVAVAAGVGVEGSKSGAAMRRPLRAGEQGDDPEVGRDGVGVGRSSATVTSTWALATRSRALSVVLGCGRSNPVEGVDTGRTRSGS